MAKVELLLAFSLIVIVIVEWHGDLWKDSQRIRFHWPLISLSSSNKAVNFNRFFVCVLWLKFEWMKNEIVLSCLVLSSLDGLSVIFDRCVYFFMGFPRNHSSVFGRFTVCVPNANKRVRENDINDLYGFIFFIRYGWHFCNQTQSRKKKFAFFFFIEFGKHSFKSNRSLQKWTKNEWMKERTNKQVVHRKGPKTENFHKSQKSDYFCGIISISNIVKQKSVQANDRVWHAFDVNAMWSHKIGCVWEIWTSDNGNRKKGKPIERTRYRRSCRIERKSEEKVNYTKRV